MIPKVKILQHPSPVGGAGHFLFRSSFSPSPGTGLPALFTGLRGPFGQGFDWQAWRAANIRNFQGIVNGEKSLGVGPANSNASGGFNSQGFKVLNSRDPNGAISGTGFYNLTGAGGVGSALGGFGGYGSSSSSGSSSSDASSGNSGGTSQEVTD